MKGKVLSSGKQKIREQDNRNICMTPDKIIHKYLRLSPSLKLLPQTTIYPHAQMHTLSITSVSINSNLGSSESTNSDLPHICEHICNKVFCFALLPKHHKHLRA